MRAEAKTRQIFLLAAACLLGGSPALAAPAGRGQAESSSIDREFRAAYPTSTRPPGKPVAGVALAKLVIPGLQLTGRSERTAADGGLVLSFADGTGAVRAVVQLAVFAEPTAARQELDAELHGVSSQLAPAADTTLGELTWVDDAGKGTALVLAAQANLAYSVRVLDQGPGVPTAAAIARVVRAAIVPGAPMFPAATVTLPSTLDARGGGEVRVTVNGGHPYKLRAEGGYITRAASGAVVRPLGPGQVTVHATVVDELARVTDAWATTRAQ